VSTVNVSTDSDILVQGAVEFINAAATDELNLSAGQSIQVVTDTGSISMTDSGGDLSGSLGLTAHDVWVCLPPAGLTPFVGYM